MKELIFGAAIIVAGLTTSAVAQEARQDFTLDNRTGYDISEVYVSPTKTDDWEEDVLGDDELEDGKSTEIKFKRNVRTCIWDLKVVYSDDESSAIWKDIDLCKISKITIRYDRSTKSTRATFD